MVAQGYAVVDRFSRPNSILIICNADGNVFVSNNWLGCRSGVIVNNCVVLIDGGLSGAARFGMLLHNSIVLLILGVQRNSKA